MPNLNQNYSLKQKYFHLNENERETLDYIEKREAQIYFQKAFRNERINENFNEINLSFNNSNKQPNIIKYFENELKEEVTLLFIDINSFSKTTLSLSSTDIKEFLDLYYKTVIPIIYKHGGEIEKLMGDGIIAVFGKPFLEKKSPENIYAAEKCSLEIIEIFRGTIMSVKVAIHVGEIIYYKVPGDDYGEYTIIGQPITDLYRLESISIPDSINFFNGSNYDQLGWKYSIFDENTICNFKKFDVTLQGINFTSAKSFSPLTS